MYEGAVCTNPYIRRASDVSVIVYTQMVRGSLNDECTNFKLRNCLRARRCDV